MAKWFIPEGLSERIIKALEDNTHPLYAEITTIDEKREPKVSSVLLRYIAGHGTLGFFAHVHSQEWQHLTKKPHLAGTFREPLRKIRCRWEGAVELLCGEKHAYILDRRWLELGDDVRRAFWQNTVSDSIESNEIALNLRCPSVGIVLCRPDVWEIPETDDSNPERTTRYISRGNGWLASVKGSLVAAFFMHLDPPQKNGQSERVRFYDIRPSLFQEEFTNGQANIRQGIQAWRGQDGRG